MKLRTSNMLGKYCTPGPHPQPIVVLKYSRAGLEHNEFAYHCQVIAVTRAVTQPPYENPKVKLLNEMRGVAIFLLYLMLQECFIVF